LKSSSPKEVCAGLLILELIVLPINTSQVKKYALENLVLSALSAHPAHLGIARISVPLLNTLADMNMFAEGTETVIANAIVYSFLSHERLTVQSWELLTKTNIKVCFNLCRRCCCLRDNIYATTATYSHLAEHLLDGDNVGGVRIHDRT